MSFSNPIIGGNDTLVRDAIQSEGFVSGSTGWRIERDGTAEFNSVTVRGELDVTGTDGSYVRALAQGGHADVLLQPQDLAGFDWEPGTLRADIASTTDNPQISLIGPSNQGATSSAAEILIQGPGDPDASQIIMSSADGIQLDLGSHVNLLNSGTWIRRGEPTNLSLAAGWTAFGGGFSDPKYVELPDGFGQLFGVASGTPPGTIGTLPSALRPSVIQGPFSCACNNGKHCQIVVNPNGTVVTQNADASVTWVSLANVRWPISG